jgi:hypothetical protein
MYSQHNPKQVGYLLPRSANFFTLRSPNHNLKNVLFSKVLKLEKQIEPKESIYLSKQFIFYFIIALPIMHGQRGRTGFLNV